METLSKFTLPAPAPAEALGSGKWKLFLDYVVCSSHRDIATEKTVNRKINKQTNKQQQKRPDKSRMRNGTEGTEGKTHSEWGGKSRGRYRAKICWTRSALKMLLLGSCVYAELSSNRGHRLPFQDWHGTQKSFH